MNKYLLSSIALIGIAAASNAEVTVVPSTLTLNGKTFILESTKKIDVKSDNTLSQQEDNTFNDMNLIATSVTRQWDPVWEQFTDKSKIEYEYNADGMLVKKSHYNNAIKEPSEAPDWTEANYYTYTYNDDHKMTLMENTRNSNGEYFVAEHVEYEYDSNGRLVKESRSSAWSPTGSLDLRLIVSYTEFNEAGQPLAYTTDNYYNGEVVSTTKGTYTYDSNGNCTVSAIFSKNDEGEFVKSSETVCTFTDDNMVDTEIYYATERSSGQWGPFYRWDYIYSETEGYPIKKENHVYALDFMSENHTNTYEYTWKLVKDDAVNAIAADSDLNISLNGSLLSVSCTGMLTGVTLYDMEGRALRTVRQPAGITAALDASGLKGCFIVVAGGDFGSKAKKITF